MKKVTLTTLLSIMMVTIWAQQKPIPSSWGHYTKLSGYSPAPVKGLEKMDSLQFELGPGDTRIGHIHRPASNKTNIKEDKNCDTLDCSPTSLIGKGRNRTTHYLKPGETFSIAAPPANSSAQTRAELDYLLELQAQRTEEDKRASAFYANVFYPTATKPGDNDYAKYRRNLFHMGRSIATWFHPDSLPITANLVANSWKDAEYFIWKYKNHFVRIRPFKLEPRLQPLEVTNWAAYPSGHASNSYVNAYLFSELLPEYSSFFLKDAYDMAHSREIIGVHYPSDSESARQLAHQLVQRLLATPTFKKDFEAAKAEIDKAKQKSLF